MEELRGNAVLGEGLGAVAFRKETTVIAKADGSYDDDAEERSLFDNKRQSRSLIIRNM